MEKQEDKIFRIFEEVEQSSGAGIKQASGAETIPAPKLRSTKAVPKKTEDYKDIKKDTKEYYKALRKSTKEYYKTLRKQSRKEAKEQQRFTRKRERNIREISEQISKSSTGKRIRKPKSDNIVYLRLTPPKGKRNPISRIRHRNQYDRGDYDYIKENIRNGYITPNTIANGELTKRQWIELQRYEDAREDVTIKNSWRRFKALIAVMAITGALANTKTIYDGITRSFEKVVFAVGQDAGSQNSISERRAKLALIDGTDQQLLYEYTNGDITEANWEKLPEGIKDYIRNPVIAAEATYKYGNDLSNFYKMVDGDFTTEAWEKLPKEIQQFVREPVSTAKEYFENGKDQKYLYEISSGRMTEEFWKELPDEIKQYVRNPIELAKEFERQGDDLGYLANLSEITDGTQLSNEVWRFLPKELKAHVVDPKLVISVDELQLGLENNQQTQENNSDWER